MFGGLLVTLWCRPARRHIPSQRASQAQVIVKVASRRESGVKICTQSKRCRSTVGAVTSELREQLKDGLHSV